MEVNTGRGWQGMPETQRDLSFEIPSQVFPRTWVFLGFAPDLLNQNFGGGAQESPVDSRVVTAGLGFGDGFTALVFQMRSGWNMPKSPESSSGACALEQDSLALAGETQHPYDFD